MKWRVGCWVIVTRRRFDGPTLEAFGKIVEASADHATAECWVDGSVVRFTRSADTESIVSFRKPTSADWARRKRQRSAYKGRLFG